MVEPGGLEAFFKVSLERVKQLCDVFDSYGHLDYAVRYAPHKNKFYSWNDYESYIRLILKLLIENGKCWNAILAVSVMGWEIPIHVLIFSVCIGNWAANLLLLVLMRTRRRL